jgi:membrane protease YdiL (CAAX protease family)
MNREDFMTPEPPRSDEPRPEATEKIPQGRPIRDGEGPFAPSARAVLPYAGAVPFARKAPVFAMPMTRWRAVVELLLLLPGAFVGLMIASLVTTVIAPVDVRWHNIGGTVGMAVGCVTVIAIVMLIDRHPPMTIGLTTRQFGLNAAIGLATLVATYVLIIQIMILAFSLFPNVLPEESVAQQEIEKVFPPMSFRLVVLMCILVALWEEIVFRGFIMTRLQAILRRWWLTLPVAAVLFAVQHWYEGVLAMVMVGLLGTIMGGLLIWRKSLVGPFVLHLLHNLFMFTLLEAVFDTWS